MQIPRGGIYLNITVMIMCHRYISNDERPEFSKMLSDIDDGKVDIILAKDLSRIGRKGSSHPQMELKRHAAEVMTQSLLAS